MTMTITIFCSKHSFRNVWKRVETLGQNHTMTITISSQAVIIFNCQLGAEKYPSHLVLDHQVLILDQHAFPFPWEPDWILASLVCHRDCYLSFLSWHDDDDQGHVPQRDQAQTLLFMPWIVFMAHTALFTSWTIRSGFGTTQVTGWFMWV